MNLLKDPFLHFLLIGAALFATYRLVNRESAPDPQQIIVSPGQIEHMTTTFARTWQRPPTSRELNGLIDQYVKEEIFSREAVKLGLDRNDTVIRRRLQQKMEFITDDLLSAEEPTDATLNEFLAKHPDAFRTEPRYTFRQVFYSAGRRGEALESDVLKLLAELKDKGAEADISELGDPTLLPLSMTNETRRSVENTFGREFSAALTRAAAGEWIGPIRSNFGLHLVLIEQREDGGVPELAEVREAVRREWEHARREESARKFFEDLLNQYQVVVDWPKPQPVKKTASLR